MTPRELGRFLQNCGDGTVFFFAELDGVLYARVIELAAQAENDIELGIDARSIGRTFAGADHFEGMEPLAFFLEDDDDVSGGAGTESHEKQLHGSRGGEVFGIKSDGMARRTDGDELLFADPLDCCSLHGASPVPWRIARKRAVKQAQ